MNNIYIYFIIINKNGSDLFDVQYRYAIVCVVSISIHSSYESHQKMDNNRFLIICILFGVASLLKTLLRNYI